MIRPNKALAAVLAAACATTAVWGQEEEGAPSEGLVFTFQRADVHAFIGYLSREGGFTFLEEAAVTGDITAIAERPLTPDQALEVLRAWLLPRERTLLRTGDVVRIVTIEEAQRRGLPVRVGSRPDQIPDNDELVTQVMPLRYVQAEDVKRELEGLLSDRGSVMLEGTSNSLVVRDTSSSIRRFAEVLDALDQAVTAEVRVKVYRLENARAEEVAEIVRNMFGENNPLADIGEDGGGGGPGGGRGGGRGGRGRMEAMARMFMEGGSGGGAGVGDVAVTHDARTNSVVVTAGSDQLLLIDSLIAELDREPDSVLTEVRAFNLENADAEDLKETLEVLFEQTASSNNEGDNVRNFFRRFGRGGGGEDNQSSGSNDPYAPTARFTTDVRTNTLIVSATETDMALVSQLVGDLDRDPTESSAVLVVPLQNAEAEGLAEVLTQVLAEESANAGGGNTNNNRNNRRGRQQTTSTTESNGNGLVGDVTVVPDSEANALVFTTSPNNFDRLRAIVGSLDTVRREVFIECLIAEVQLNDRGELGIQWNAAFTNSIEDADEGSQGVGTDFGLDALGDGLRYTTSSDTLTGLLRALQTEGRLNILSSPKILVLENQAAEISVGQEVPFVTNSRITQNGDTVNTIQYRDVGIILQVTPQINDTGYVRMLVHPEVSSIAPDSQSVTITEGVRSPTFNRNYADTSIVIRTGETAVIGGMIQDSLSETEFKIPFLGDIPILGNLFKSTSREKVKQEIVVFLTPRIVQEPGELRERSREALAQYAFVPTEVLESRLNTWLAGLDDDQHAYHYNRGTVYLESGRLQEAVESLESARDLRPSDIDTRLNLALAYTQGGELESAETELREGLRLSPSDVDMLYNLGCVLWRQGDYPQAARTFQGVLLQDPSHEDARRWLPRAEREAERVGLELIGE